MLDAKGVVHVDVVCLCTICKWSCYAFQWIPMREIREVHTAVFLKFWLCAGTGTLHCHVGLSMQRNLTQSWVRGRLYMICNGLNALLIQYSNLGCFSPNITWVQFWDGVGGACSLNGVEYKYIPERKMQKDSHSSVIISIAREMLLWDSWSSASHKMIQSISSCCMYPWQLSLHPFLVCSLSVPRTKVCSVGWDCLKPWAQTGATCPSWWRWYQACQVLQKAVVSLGLPWQ